MQHIAPAPAHALGPKLGEMTWARAYELNGAMTDLFAASEGIYEPDRAAELGNAALEKLAGVPLADLAQAAKVVSEHSSKRNADGTTTFYVTCADRLVAAIYALMNYQSNQDDYAIFNLPCRSFLLGNGRAYLVMCYRTDEQIAATASDEDDED